MYSVFAKEPPNKPHLAGRPAPDRRTARYGVDTRPKNAHLLRVNSAFFGPGLALSRTQLGIVRSLLKLESIRNGSIACSEPGLRCG